ncbi:MAG: M28 family peptidase [Candidatus Fermentithermobacillus carboniphilus]|uniref:M28 family peptidase n=1 Tax=Candidatus Fermentithermobacillus carboniphilus TaxID=3085328 RepID=A0AAT9LE83_9FIRM|nr:MAG: M28 family peptidase [Candidatus Fermentithermobacillus carboniphilus]
MQDEDLKKSLLATISAAEMQKHLHVMSGLHRRSGSPDDFKAVDYIVDYLSGYGIPVQVYEFSSLISYPVGANLRTLVPTEREFHCKTRALSPSTPPQGIVAEVVYVPIKDGTPGILGDDSLSDDFQGIDVRGKIVITDRGGPDGVLYAQRAGAVGLINAWPSDEDVIHEMIASPVWGTPTPESASWLPKIPCVSVTKRDGDILKEMCNSGTVKAILRTETDTAWRKLRLPVAQVEGTEEPEKFVLVGGHLDSWYVGITDNATGNAASLEMARVFHQFRDRLKRSVRFAWWPGHSYGRYSGSTWYNDNFWLDLYDNCLAYNNIDSPGCAGADDYSKLTAMGELKDLVEETASMITNMECFTVRPTRAADQSFWGTGVPSMFFLMGNRPKEKSAQVGGSAGGWWWHSEYDILDKADIDILVRDTKIYSLAVLRMVADDILPYRYARLAREISETLASYQREANDSFSLELVMNLAGRFAEKAEEFDARVKKTNVEPSGARKVNEYLLKVSRCLIPVLYTEAGPFHQDLAISMPFIPGLYGARKIRTLGKSSSEFYYLLTKLTRERNRLALALREAIVYLDRAIAVMSGE